MRISKLHITSYGKLKDKTITFSDGLNVIYGKNESGKSTISAFIEAMLYSYPPRSSDREKYFPWDGTIPSGSLTLTDKGSDITISRRFGLNSKSDTLEITPPCSLEGLIPPSRDAYRKSIYSPEGGSSLFGSSAEIEAKIANIMATGDENISATAAINSLDKLHRSIKAKRGSSGKLNELDNQITLLENELAEASSYQAHEKELTKALEEAEARITEYENSLSSIRNERLKVHADAIKNVEDSINTAFQRTTKPLPESRSSYLSILSCIFLFIICLSASFIIGIIYFMIKKAFTPFALLPLLLFFSSLLINCFNGYVSKKKSYSPILAKNESSPEYIISVESKKSFSYSSDRLSLLDEKEKELNIKLHEATEAVANIKAELNHNPYRSISVIQEDLAYCREQRNALLKQLNAIDAAIEALEYAKDAAKSSFTPLINEKASEYLNRIAPKPGRQVTVSSDLKLSLTDSDPRDISSSSFGFREEMYLCFRLALSDFLYQNTLPLIFDDPFHGSDDYREKAIIDLLLSLSEDRQIIIFTNRKNNYFSQLNCNWVDISPQPDV